MLGLPADFTVPDVIPLNTPSVPVPSIINTERALERAAESLRAASGPVAVDTERAQGIRYGIRAFLVQLKREDKLYLIDPEAFSDLRIINDALADTEWIIHAATQDFPSLDLLGMRPRLLFDTELGARLAGLERVNLGAVVEELLGYKLEKKHSQEDWSQRPLPESWLNYACLDVDVLATAGVVANEKIWSEIIKNKQLTGILLTKEGIKRVFEEGKITDVKRS